MKRQLLFSILLSGVTSLYGYDFYGNYLFFKQSMHDMRKIGAIMPTSRSAANELVRPLSFKVGARNILEVGAGTGAITEVIIAQLTPEDRFDIIEIDPALCQILHKKFGHLAHVHINSMSIEQWNPGYTYDVIISTIPLTNLAIEDIETIFNHFQYLAAPGAVFSYLEYMSAPLKKLFINSQKAAVLQEKLQYMHDFRGQFRSNSVKVFVNVPPTYAHHIVLPGKLA
ncbi:MAG: methyltransferase [Candidatus Dependentiae bacterium]